MRSVIVVALLALTSCSRVRALTEGEPSAPSPSPQPPPTLTSAAPPNTARLPAFPGAEGFGAFAQGGRGGSICNVTTLAHDGPGSLQSCFDQAGPRTVVFAVTGVIQGPLEIKHGRLTIAGQTSPGGVIVKGGVVCDNVYDPNDCSDVIVRHVRFRGGDPDSFRIGGAHDVILDHCSFAAAEDENIEITRSRNVTVQHSIIAEPRGEHYKWGGVLINYSKDVMPLDGITIHHSVWNGVAGRLPEISCEDNGDGPGRTNCTGHVLSIELTNNVLFDASDPIWFNGCTGTNEGNDCARPGFSVRMNLIGNVLLRRNASDAPFAEPSLFAAHNAVFSQDNRLGGAPQPSRGGRHAFPTVTVSPSSTIVAELARTAGAFPRDAMDTRLAGYLAKPVAARPLAWKNENGVEPTDAFTPHAAMAANTNPATWRASGPCAAGYTPLECYVNEQADAKAR